MSLFNIKPLFPKYEGIGDLSNFLNWFRDWLLANDEAHEAFFNFELAKSQKISISSSDWDGSNQATKEHNLSYAPTMEIMGVPSESAIVWLHTPSDSDNIYAQYSGTAPNVDVIVY